MIKFWPQFVIHYKSRCPYNSVWNTMYYKLRYNSTQFVMYYKLRNYYKMQRSKAVQGSSFRDALKKSCRSAKFENTFESGIEFDPMAFIIQQALLKIRQIFYVGLWTPATGDYCIMNPIVDKIWTTPLNYDPTFTFWYFCRNFSFCYLVSISLFLAFVCIFL